MSPLSTIHWRSTLAIRAIAVLLFLCDLPAAAQVSISGTVLNQADKKGIANASVFLNNATIGTTSDTSGHFVLSIGKPGKYELVISAVGFERYHEAIITSNDPVDLGKIELPARPIALQEVHINSGRNANWQRNYQWFKDAFLGTTSLAEDCKIVNPDVLGFIYRSKTDSLMVRADDFLIIENNALGYRVKYLINYFVRCESGRKIRYEGFVLFENMKGTPRQEKTWLNKRRQAYEGSAMHFFRTAISNRLKEDGFQVFQEAIYANPERPTDSLIDAKLALVHNKLKTGDSRYQDSSTYWTKKQQMPKLLYALMNFPLDASEIIYLTDEKGIFALGCENDGLYVMYNKRHHFPNNADMNFLVSPYNSSNTLLNFISPFALFDNYGWVINPGSLSFIGAWSQNRVAGLLPMDYDPDH